MKWIAVAAALLGTAASAKMVSEVNTSYDMEGEIRMSNYDIDEDKDEDEDDEMRMSDYKSITTGLPSGFKIQKDRFESDFSLFKDGVLVASGEEHSVDQWVLTYYAAPETKPILDSIMRSFGRYKKQEHEQWRLKSDAETKAAQDKARSAALNVLKDYLK